MQYVKTPPNNLQVPFLYYTNKAINIQNEYAFQHTSGQVYVFNPKDHHHDAFPLHFNL